MQVCQQLLYCGTLVVLERLQSVYGDDSMSQETLPNGPQNGRPHVATATHDRYMVLQHLHIRRLTAAATGRQHGIHPQIVRNQLR